MLAPVYVAHFSFPQDAAKRPICRTFHNTLRIFTKICQRRPASATGTPRPKQEPSLRHEADGKNAATTPPRRSNWPPDLGWSSFIRPSGCTGTLPTQRPPSGGRAAPKHGHGMVELGNGVPRGQRRAVAGRGQASQTGGITAAAPAP
ncbi:hypothetical protein GCM10009734_21060 [Nonomuraea bangladeshensis]